MSRFTWTDVKDIVVTAGVVLIVGTLIRAWVGAVNANTCNRAVLAEQALLICSSVRDEKGNPTCYATASEIEHALKLKKWCTPDKP